MRGTAAFSAPVTFSIKPQPLTSEGTLLAGRASTSASSSFNPRGDGPMADPEGDGAPRAGRPASAPRDTPSPGSRRRCRSRRRRGHRCAGDRGSRSRALRVRSAAQVGFRREMRREHFNGHVAIEPRFARAIHLAHPSVAELLEDAIWTECGADHRILRLGSARPCTHRCGRRSSRGPRPGYGGPAVARSIRPRSEGGAARAQWRDDFVGAEASPRGERHCGEVGAEYS